MKLSLASSRGILLTQGLRLGVRLGTAASLARLLQPREFGLFGMAALVHGIAYVLQDAGLATLTLRKPGITASEKNAFFWLNAGAGAVLATAVALASPLISAWYGEWAVATILPVLAVTFLINGLHAQLRAQMARENRFAEINRIEIAGFVVSSAVAVTAAALGAGYWALVALPVTAEITIAIGVWRLQRWRPGAIPRPLPFSLLVSSAPFSGFELIRYLIRNADQLLVGRWFGASILGYYGRAAQLVALPVQYGADPLNQWAIVRLAPHEAPAPGAKAAKEAPESWSMYLNGLMHLFLPLALMFYFVPAAVLETFFGSQWAPAAPMLRGLAIGLAAQPLLVATSWLLIARGRTLQLILMSAATSLGLVAACLMIRPMQEASYIAFAAGSVLLAAGIAGTGWAAISTGLGLGAAVRGTIRPFLIASLAAFCLRALLNLGIPDIPLDRLATGGATVAGCWLAAAFFWGGARAELRDHFLLRTDAGRRTNV